MREQDVIDVLNVLDPNKAVGPDIISNKMLIAVKNEVAKPLCLLFNKSFQCKIFPNNWENCIYNSVTSLCRQIIDQYLSFHA